MLSCFPVLSHKLTWRKRGLCFPVFSRWSLAILCFSEVLLADILCCSLALLAYVFSVLHAILFPSVLPSLPSLCFPVLSIGNLASKAILCFPRSLASRLSYVSHILVRKITQSPHMYLNMSEFRGSTWHACLHACMYCVHRHCWWILASRGNAPTRMQIVGVCTLLGQDWELVVNFELCMWVCVYACTYVCCSCPTFWYLSK